MIIDKTLQRHIAKTLLDEYKKKRSEHIPSGKLSASGLGKPLQWQILKTIGVPPKELDEYVMRKFTRGDHVENWLVSNLIDCIDTQKEVEYKDVVGIADSVIDTLNYESKVGIICNEIKSITNAAYKWLEKDKQIKLGHALQGALYGLAMGHKYFAVTYVASDDYRITMMIEPVAKYKPQIEGIIANYNTAIKNKIVPVFEAVEKWQEKEIYSDYPEWADLTQTEINEKLKKFNIKWPIIEK
jgi:hypothetical protein